MSEHNFPMNQLKIKHLQESIIRFYQNEGRKFPWRTSHSPYVTLVSEILLQKTTSKQVLEVFHEFFRKFPTINSLATADPREIEAIVGKLGLAKRAGFLKELAETIINELGGKIPDSTKELLKLKGVGLYTANAVLCFAFNKRAPVVDSNVARILRRYFGVEGKKPAYADRQIWKIAEAVLPNKNFREFNYGLLDLAAKYCHPKEPECKKCPLRTHCSFRNKISLS